MLGSAYTQRGALLLQLAESLDNTNSRTTKDRKCAPEETEKEKLQMRDQDWPEELIGKSKKQLEEMANVDFEMGGTYGNEVGRDMAKKTNVWAKMCGAIVQEVMQAEMGGRNA